MSTKLTNNQELNYLADYLSRNKETILQRWELAAKEEIGKAAELIVISHEKFQNSIPDFLENLNNHLRNLKASTKHLAKEHGAKRWEYGFNLHEIMLDWSLLHLVLMAEINSYHETHGLSSSSLKKAQKLLAKAIHEGILYSVDQFRQLQKSEADAQLHDLKQAFKKPDSSPNKEELRQTSHDIKGIAHTLRMGFYLLKDEVFDEKKTEIIDQMSTAADSLNQLLTDLLDLFRLEAGKETIDIQYFDAAQLFKNLCKSNQPLANAEGLNLRCMGDEKIMIKSDPKKVRRIVQNLVLNSLKYTEQGFVEIEWRKENDEVWTIRVTDTGPGLGSTHAATLTTKSGNTVSTKQSTGTLEPSKTRATKKHGEGIGLLIVRHLCELLNAVIDIRTEEEKGTTYRISFPVETSVGTNT